MDVFRRSEMNFGGAMATDMGMLTANRGLSGILLQNMQLTYAQNITRIYELGETGRPTSVYYVGGRSQGTMSVGHVVGPRATMAEFYFNFSDVCLAEFNDIEFSVRAQCGGISDGTRITYKAKYCVLTQIGMSVSAQDFVINENSQLMFSNLEYTEI